MAYAQVALSDNILYFEPDDKVMSVMVRNLSHYKTFTIHAASLEVQNPGGPDSQLVKAPILMAAPNIFVLEPRSEVPVKIMYYRPEAIDVEKVYKLRFMPKADGYSTDEDDQYITVITGAGALIFVQPDEKKPLISWDRKDNVITLMNEGNVNVEVLTKEVCLSDAPTICHTIAGKRIYPTKSYQFILPADFITENINLDLMINLKKQQVSVPVEPRGLN